MVVPHPSCRRSRACGRNLAVDPAAVQLQLSVEGNLGDVISWPLRQYFHAVVGDRHNLLDANPEFSRNAVLRLYREGHSFLEGDWIVQ